MITFIVVDDEALAQEAFLSSVVWENYGFQAVGTAANGRLGLELVRKVHPDVVFTDIKMPVMDGIELCEHVSAEFPNIKLVLLTAYKDFEYAQRALQYGVSDYILKNQISEERIGELLGKLNQHFTAKSSQDRLSAHNLRQSILLGDNPAYTPEMFSAPARVACLYVYVEPPFMEVLAQGEVPVPMTYLDSYRSSRMIYGNLQIFDVLWIDSNTRLFLAENVEKKRAQTASAAQYLIQDIKGKYLAEDKPFRLTFLFEEVPGTFAGVKECLERMQKFRHRSKYSYQNDYGNYKDYMSLYPQREWHRHKVQEMVSLLSSHLEEHHIEGVKNVLKELEDYYKRPTYYGPAFFYICGALYDVLNNMLAEKKMESAEKVIGKSPEKVWHLSNEKEIFSWFSERILDLAALEKIQFSGDINNRIKKVISFVAGNYDQKITAAAAAEKVGLSETYFNSLFKKETGISFAAYLLNVRIEAAKHLLRHSDAKIYEIAEKSGFSSQQYFAQVFEKETGYTPLMYRRLSKVDHGKT